MTAYKLGHSISVGLLALSLLIGCTNLDGYEKEVMKELDSGIRNDSIFFDIKFGDSRDEFFNTCRDYNQKGILFHGSQNMNIKYLIIAPNDSVSDISMEFYPDFKFSSEIRKMKVEFSFSAWAPWNDHLYGDQLFPYVKKQIIDWYGGHDFWELTDQKGEKVWAKIDGNREMKMKIIKDRYIKLIITDKSYKPI